LEEIQDWGWANALHPDDGLADPEYGRAHTQAIVGATFRVLKGTGHVLQLETPELLVETIWPFVTEGAVLASIQ
jgi:pimeloyl-ACP methyl ester carboxylesterase